MSDQVQDGVMRALRRSHTSGGYGYVPLDFWLCKGSGCPGHLTGTDGCPDAVRDEYWNPVEGKEQL